ncbi:MAG: site-specific integrase [Candidatus Methanoplasma sp.]|nr:site-specific integrase [Candidatus Methanoplasma sp.]
MSKYPRSVASSINSFVEDIRKDPNYAVRTAQHYFEECTCVFKILQEHRPDILPHNVTIEDVNWLLLEMRDRGFAVSTQRGYVSALRQICTHYDNNTIVQKKIRWPQDMRPNVDWLTYEQAKTLLECPKTANQDLIIHLELCMGFRRCEVSRLQPKHILNNYVDVVGKGSMGGKMRSVPFHPRTADVFSRYDRYRKNLHSVAQERHRTPLDMPDRYLVYERAGRVYNYSEVKLTGLDKNLDPLKESLGFNFSNHTLRRTFGRTMYRSGVKVATIAKLLGHESEQSTLRYIGVDLDDMSDAMDIFSLR